MRLCVPFSLMPVANHPHRKQYLIAMLSITFLMSRVSKDDWTLEGGLEVWDRTDNRRPPRVGLTVRAGLVIDILLDLVDGRMMAR